MNHARLAIAAARACAAAAALAAAPAWCQIYAGAEPAGGAIVLSNFRSDATPVLVAGEAAAPEAAGARARAARSERAAAAPPLPPAELQRLIAAVAERTQVSAGLLHAVISAESRYDARAVSNKGAIGLMQLLPATGRRFGAQDLYSAEQNVAAGASYLKWLMGVFDQDLELVLAAYNAGEQAVLRAGRKVPPYPETRAYVKAVMAALQQRTASASL